MTDILRPKALRGYRPCVGIALFSRDGRVFIGKRSAKGVLPQYSWQMPQGGIDAGETPEAAARRELFEETSVRSATLLGSVDGWLHYDLPRELAVWRGRYRGQAQRWYAFRFDGEDGEINVAHPPEGHQVEFSAWRWARLSEAAELVVPFKRAVYEHVAAAFAPFALPESLRDAPAEAI